MKVRITSIPNFITFLKKLKAVEKSAILEITKDAMFSKVHTPDKCVMKSVKLSYDEVFEGKVDWKSLKCDRIKIGIIDITRIMEAFKHFRPEEEVFMEMKIDKRSEECLVTELFLVSDSLKIRLRCADFSLLSYVQDDILEMVHSKENYGVSFKLYQSDFTTLLSLCGLENNSEEILHFELSNGKINAIGDSFNYRLNISGEEIESQGHESWNSDIYKNQLSHMEAETCQVYLHENRIAFFSDQSQTSIAIGLVVK